MLNYYVVEQMYKVACEFEKFQCGVETYMKFDRELTDTENMLNNLTQAEFEDAVDVIETFKDFNDVYEIIAIDYCAWLYSTTGKISKYYCDLTTKSKKIEWVAMLSMFVVVVMFVIYTLALIYMY